MINLMCCNKNTLWRFGVKLRHSIRAVSGAPLSSRGLEEALQNEPELYFDVVFLPCFS